LPKFLFRACTIHPTPLHASACSSTLGTDMTE
jgi:hypothetical protein